MPLQDAIRAEVADLSTFDAIEAAHRRATLRWLDGTDDVFRRVPPDTPPRHLVVYCLLVDPEGSVLLADHRKSGLWLPAGGHVEPGEGPLATVRRETREELGIEAQHCPAIGERPLFLSVARTVPVDGRQHTDVSLWYALDARQGDALTPDPGEFHGVRWWTPEEISATDARRFDPHLRRVIAKRARIGHDEVCFTTT